MNFLWDFIKGMIIGVGAVAPGVSGGTFAVMLGIYDKLTDAIANVFNDFKKKLILFFPLMLGIGVGILSFSNIMKYLFTNHNAHIKYLFIGLMIGTLPSVFKEANKSGFKKIYLLPCIITFSITILFVILENSVINIIPENNLGIITLIMYGVIISFGTIVPGISSSFILMYIGAYEILLDGIVNIDLSVLIPVGIGFVVSSIIFAKLISLLFKKFYGYTYYAVLGFVVGSIITIFPGIKLNLEYFIGIILCFIGFYLSFTLCNYKKSK
jgi:putative membrane protein